MSTIIFGKVISFFDTPERHYGFATGLKQNTFFHMNYQKLAICDGGDEPAMHQPTEYRVPKRDEEIGFVPHLGHKGPIALRWFFKDDYIQALKDIAERIMVRFIEHRGPEWIGRMLPWDYKSPRIMWEGNNLSDLRKKFPVSHYPLAHTKDLRRWFEYKQGKEWVSLERDIRGTN